MVIELGDKVKDPVTGIEGIAYLRISYLQGCDRIGIQEPVIREKGKEAIVPDIYHVDEPQLVIIKKQIIKKAKVTTTGGPSGFGPSGKMK